MSSPRQAVLAIVARRFRRRLWRSAASVLPLLLVTQLIVSVPVSVQPVPIVAVSPTIVSLAAGLSHSVARRFDGTVWTWGANSSSQLGDGTTTGRLSPTQIPGFEGVAAVSAGLAHSMAVKDDGTVWTWGNPGAGRLGRSGDTTRPGQVPALTAMTAISAGSSHSLAVRGSDGTVWAWGSNVSG
ncbi:MAG: RCC1 domain-containing protein, partial [Acidimicrobiales bacterium]